MRSRIVDTVLGGVGGAVGGLLGYLAFRWLASQGFYALILPGAFLGLGCSLLARGRSLVRGVLCGLAGLGLGLYSEWREFPFVKDESFGFMVVHFLDKPPIKPIMLVFGALVAFWIGKDAGYTGLAGRPRGATPPGDG